MSMIYYLLSKVVSVFLVYWLKAMIYESQINKSICWPWMAIAQICGKASHPLKNLKIMVFRWSWIKCCWRPTGIMRLSNNHVIRQRRISSVCLNYRSRMFKISAVLPEKQNFEKNEFFWEMKNKRLWDSPLSYFLLKYSKMKHRPIFHLI